MPSKTHWDQVYSTKSSDAVSWYQPHAERSLRLIRAAGLPSSAPIIDIGGGASTLVDDLLADGYSNLSVLDLSEAALSVARQRLGAAGEAVQWRAADITTVDLPSAAYALWHDRAVFHFLTELEQRQAYRQRLRSALMPGGHQG